MAIKAKKVKLGVRERRKLRVRKKVVGSDERPRICVYRSSKYTYAQVISDQSQCTLLSASTCEQEVLESVKSLPVEQTKGAALSSKSVVAARALGLVLAKRAQEKGITKLVFDRNGFLFCGRVKGVAEGVRAGGIVI